MTRPSLSTAVLVAAVLGVTGCGSQGTADGDDAPAADAGDASSVTASDDGASVTDLGSSGADQPDAVGDPRSIRVTLTGGAFDPADGRRWTNAGPLVVDEGDRITSLRNSFNASSGPAQTDVVVSSDGGSSWEEVGPSIAADAAPWTDQLIMPWSLVAADDRWVLYVEEFTSASGLGSIGRATAPSLEGPWTVDEAPVLEPGDDDSWRSAKVGTPAVLRDDDGRWRMWFTGTDGGLTSGIGHATSQDGVTWEVDEQPVFTGGQDWDNGDVGTSRVVRLDDEYVLVYDRQSRGGGPIGLAFSEDGLSWVPAAGNPVLERDQLEPGALFSTSAVVADGRLLLLQEIAVGGGTGGSRVHVVEMELDGG